MRCLIVFIALALGAMSALAGETAWQEVAPGVSIRLISTGEVREGRALVGLEIDMPESTKTYWRVPGETGIPTQIDIVGSQGIVGHEVLWPYPTIDTASGYVDYAYFGPTVLPVELQLGEAGAANLQLSAILGICEEVCIPVDVAFELPLGSGAPDRANGLRIRQAVALAPLAWEGDVPVGAIRYDAGSSSILMELASDEIDPASLIGALPGGMPLLGPPEVDASGTTVRLPLIGNGAAAKSAELTGQPIDFVFLTDDGAFSLTSHIGH